MNHRPAPLTALLTSLALVAFAANSILCRLALGPGDVDAGAFTAMRLISGAVALSAIVSVRDRRLPRLQGRWLSAVTLFTYAFPFSLAYLRLSAGTGALVLIGGVQVTMIGWDILRGSRPRTGEWLGLLFAVAGLVYLTSPGVSAPDPLGVSLMAVAGVSWGVYSLKGKGTDDPLSATAGNFFLSLSFVLPIVAGPFDVWHTPGRGVLLAVLSGAVTSGAGYAVWYAVLRDHSPTRAAILQLTVPVLAAIGGVVALDEEISLRLILSSAAIFAGVAAAVVMRSRPRGPAGPPLAGTMSHSAPDREDASGSTDGGGGTTR
jgi:drug/metabolite transporter (DMT)-like permease